MLIGISTCALVCKCLGHSDGFNPDGYEQFTENTMRLKNAICPTAVLTQTHCIVA
jgi:hypothetical protein